MGKGQPNIRITVVLDSLWSVVYNHELLTRTLQSQKKNQKKDISTNPPLLDTICCHLPIEILTKFGRWTRRSTNERIKTYWHPGLPLHSNCNFQLYIAAIEGKFLEILHNCSGFWKSCRATAEKISGWLSDLYFPQLFW